MKVKKYEGFDMPEILEKIREELGPDAVILSSRKTKKETGSFGMFTRPILEVTAAADIDRYSNVGEPSIHVPPRLPERRPDPGGDARVKTQGMFLSLQAEIDSLREELGAMGRRPDKLKAPEPQAMAVALKNIEAKIDRLTEQKARADTIGLPPALMKLKNGLEERDLDQNLCARIFTYLQEKLDQGVVKPGEEERALRELLGRTVKVSAIPEDFGTRQVWAFIGPTGVGKTTTVAKLAARYALQSGKKVGLITVDTFRIAAVEQLRTYANIMDVPIRVAMNQDDFKSAVEEFSDRDIVLVDTAGQSPRDEEALGKLLTLFPSGVDTKVHLVISATTRSRDLEKILKHYAPAGVQRLVLTKLDETECHGPLLNLSVLSRLPLSYLTTGQNVPDDIEPATAERVVSFLMGSPPGKNQ